MISRKCFFCNLYLIAQIFECLWYAKKLFKKMQKINCGKFYIVFYLWFLIMRGWAVEPNLFFCSPRLFQFNVLRCIAVILFIIHIMSIISKVLFKSAPTRPTVKLQHKLCFEMKMTKKMALYDLFWPFLTNCVFFFQKTEVQMVILKWLRGLNLNWFGSYDSKCTYFHFCYFVIL